MRNVINDSNSPERRAVRVPGALEVGHLSQTIAINDTHNTIQ